MQTSIYYENWQMDCCGESFSIGDKVEWNCAQYDDDFLVKADYLFESHLSSDFEISGIVSEIYAVKYEYENRKGVNYPISFLTTPMTTSSEFIEKEGFLVVITDVTIKK